MSKQIFSLFKYRKYLEVQTLSKEKLSISYKEFSKLRKEGIIGFEHIEVMKFLLKYQYLTTFTLNKLIKGHNASANKKIDLEGKKTGKILTKLSKHGLAIKQNIIWEEYAKTENQNRSIYKSTPNIYTLSRGGVACMNKELGVKYSIDKYTEIVPAINIFKKVVLNNLISNYLNVNSLQNHLMNYKINKNSNKNWNTIPAVLNFKYNKESYHFLVDPVRREENWEDRLMGQFKTIKKYVLESKSDEGFFPLNTLVLLLCEDDLHMKEVHRVISGGISKDINVFFTTDARQLSEELFYSLISFKNENNKLSFVEYKAKFLENCR